MRESIGGLWLFSIVVTFIVLFVSFLAYSISYTRAFKVKNEIINYIERAEGFTKSDRDIRSITYEELSTMDNPTVDIQAYVQIQNIGYNYMETFSRQRPLLSFSYLYSNFCIYKHKYHIISYINE